MSEAIARTVEPSRLLIEPSSFFAAELDNLTEAIPTQTAIGQRVLRTMIVRGLADPAAIVEQQHAVQELLDPNHAELRDVLQSGLNEYGDNAENLHRFIDEGASSSYRYFGARQAAHSIHSLAGVATAPREHTLESPLTQQLIADIDNFSDTPAASLLRQPYYTPLGLRGEEYSHAGLRARFYTAIGIRAPMGVAAAAISLSRPEFTIMPPEVAKTILESAYPVGLAMLIPAADGRPIKDLTWNTLMVYNPLRRKVRGTPEYSRAMRAIGRLDATLALGEFYNKLRNNGHEALFPDIDGANTYHLRAKGLKNPLLAAEAGRAVVANSIELGGGEEHRLTFLTGPNSGGKSTLSKAVVQSQMLAQIGGPVAAENLCTTVADHVAYHVPSPPDLEDDSGRFGFELQSVRNILECVSEGSLTVLDDCLDGTTHEERLGLLEGVMVGLQHLSGATMFSTHAHELVETFERDGIGQFVQAEFDDMKPTFRVIPGVSHTSHAYEVAEQHGLTPDQIDAYVREKTGEAPQWPSLDR